MRRPAAAVVAVALAVVVGSVLPLQERGASARAQIGAASGPLIATDDSGAVLVAAGLQPGDSRTGEVTVLNAGDASGAFTLAATDRVDSPVWAPPLSSVLDLTVRDVTAGKIVFAGKLAELGTVSLGTFPQGEGHRYRFIVAFPGGRPAALDNPHQAASTTVSYVWAAGPVDAAAPAPAPIVRPSTYGRPLLRTKPTAVLTAARRQRARDGAIRVRLACQAACSTRVIGTADVVGARMPLRSVRRSLRAPGQVRLRIALPRQAHAALAIGLDATVRLRLRAVIAGRVVVVWRTVRVVAPRS